MKRKIFIYTFITILFSLLIFSQVKVNASEDAFEVFTNESIALIKRHEVKEVVKDSPFQTKRLIVKTNDNNIDMMGAIDYVRGDEFYLLQYNSEEDAENAYHYYTNLASVEEVEPDIIFEVEATWENSTQYVTWGADVMGVPQYNTYLLRDGGQEYLNEVIVAVLDTGIDTDHSWFKNRIVEGGKNFTSSTSSTSYDYEDRHGHGTHVAGTIVDLTLPNVKILPIKVLSDQGYGYSSMIVSAINYVVSQKENGRKIYALNMSLGGDSKVGSYSYNLYNEALTKAYNAGVLPVVAAGNEGDDALNHTPANVDCAITVAAVAQYGLGTSLYRPSWSNYGSNVDISAPGQSILSAAVGGGTTTKSGTSMATPHVAAAVAMLYSDSKYNYTIQEIETILDESAKDLGDSGWDKYYGEGLVYLEYAYTEVMRPVIFSNTTKDHIDDFKLTLTASEKDAVIYYTLDGTTPSMENGFLYEGPITISMTVEVKAISYLLSSNGEVLKYSKVNSFVYYFYGKDTEDAYKVSEDGTLLSYNGVLKEIIVPKSIDGITITKIGEYAFKNSRVVKITLPSTVTVIGANAFHGLETLEEIYAPAVTTIEMEAFYECYKLKNVNDNTFPQLLTIGKSAFYRCYSLMSITLSKVTLVDYWAFAMKDVDPLALKKINMPSVKVIGEGAFIYAKYLSEINIPNAEIIASNAFRECDIRYLDLPLAKYLGNYAFYVNQNLLSADMPSVEIIGDYSFYYFSTKLHTVNIPNAKKIGESAFGNCKALEYIDLENVIEVDAWAFYGCDKLIGFNAPNVRFIGHYAFGEITTLKKVDLPSIRHVSSDAFKLTENLEEVKLSSIITNIESTSFDGVNDKCLFYIYEGTVAEEFVKNNNYYYIDLSESDNFEYEVVNEEIIITGYNNQESALINIPSYIGNMPVTRIGDYAFSGLTNIESIKSSTLKEIGKNAFENCVNLKEIYLPEVVLIQNNAFINCVNLNKVELDKIETIGEKAFYGCVSLLEITIPNTLTQIGEKALGYSELDLIIPTFVIYSYEESVIEQYAKINEISIKYIFENITHFYYNYYKNGNSEEIYISFVDSYISGNIIIPSAYNGYQITKIGKNAFKNCNLITNIILPSSIKIIEREAFIDASSLESINLENVEEIGESAFKNCSSLKEVYLPLVTKLEDNTFANNSSLKMANLPHVIEIGESAFSNCYELEKVISPNVEIIKWQAFSYDDKLKEIDTLKIRVLGTVHTTDTITGQVFLRCTRLEKMYLPNLEIMGDDVFVNSSIKKVVIGEKFNKYYKNPVSANSGITLYGYENTLIEKYANKTGIQFEKIDEFVLEKDLPEFKSTIVNGIDNSIEFKIKGFDIIYEWYEITNEYKYIENNSGILLLDLKNSNGKKYFVRVINWDGRVIESTICEVYVDDNENLFNILIEIEGRGSVYPSNNYNVINVNKGGYKELRFTPDYGYHVESILIDGVELNDEQLKEAKENGYIFRNIESSHKIKVIFAINTYEILTQIEGNGTTNVSPKIELEHGRNSPLIIFTPDYGYHVESILVDEVELNDDQLKEAKENGYIFRNIENSHKIKVIFAINTYEILVQIEGQGTTNVSSKIELEHGSNSPLIIFTPDYGYHMESIIVDEQMLNKKEMEQAKEKGYIFEKVETNHQIKVTFAINIYEIVVETEGYGTTSAISKIEIEYGNSSDIITFTPGYGYHIESVIIDSSILNDEKLEEIKEKGIVFNNVESNHYVKVKFAINTYTIKVNIDGNGNVTPTNYAKISHGDKKTFVFNSLKGYHLSSLIVNDVEKINEDRQLYYLEIQSVEQNYIINAKFEINSYTLNMISEGNGEITSSKIVTVQHDSSHTISFVAEKGYNVSKITIDNQEIGKEELIQAKATSSYTIKNISKSSTIKVYFEESVYSIVSSYDGNGSVSIVGATSVKHGESLKITFNAFKWHHVSSIKIDGDYLVNEDLNEAIENGYTFTNIMDNHTIHVSFAIDYYNIRASVEGRGNISPSGISKVDRGDSITYYISPNEGGYITSVIIDGIHLSKTYIATVLTNGYTFTNVTKDHEIKVIYGTYKFTITSLVEGDGEISPSKNIEVEYGDTKTINFVIDESKYVARLVIDGVKLTGANLNKVITNGYTFTDIKENHSIEVSFVNKFKIESVASDGGSVTESKYLIKGESAMFAFEANEGYIIKDVLIDNISFGNISSYFFVNVSENHTVKVVFEEKKLNINIKVIGEGEVKSEKGLTDVAYNEDRKIEFIAKEGYLLEKVLLNGEEVEIKDNYLEIKNIKENVDVEVTFVKSSEGGLSCSKGNGNFINGLSDLLFMLFSLGFVGISKKKFFLERFLK